MLYLFSELLGETNDKRRYLYLSDGGHFDNMGLYELVRRRCRYVVICDSEADGALRFEGIGTAIRNCRIDFGVEVALDLRPLQHVDDNGNSTAHCVVGTIKYPEDKPKDRPGIVVYMKSSLTGDEPADVLNYKKEDNAFPHDSTVNQWFTESQFESYRRLGHHVAFSTFKPARPDKLSCLTRQGRCAYFSSLKGVWRAETPEMKKYSADHSARYWTLLHQIRTDEKLPGFFDMLFDRDSKDPLEWKKGNETSFEYAVGVSSDLIEFMFIVYMQLNLVTPENLNHSFSQGWLAIFRSWAKVDVIQQGWLKYGRGYTKGFQLFAENEVGLPERKM